METTELTLTTLPAYYFFLVHLDFVLGGTDTGDRDPKDDILLRTEAKDPWNDLLLWRHFPRLYQVAHHWRLCRTIRIHQPVRVCRKETLGSPLGMFKHALQLT